MTPRGLLGGPSPTAFGPLAAAGGLHGAAQDLLTFGEAHLGGRFAHWQGEQRPRGLPPLLRGVAPGWFVSGPAGVRWHDGVARGTRTGLAFFPEAGAAAAVLARGGLPVLGPRAGVPLLLLGLLAGDEPAAKGRG